MDLYKKRDYPHSVEQNKKKKQLSMFYLFITQRRPDENSNMQYKKIGSLPPEQKEESIKIKQKEQSRVSKAKYSKLFEEENKLIPINKNENKIQNNGKDLSAIIKEMKDFIK